jgi:uncharacterized membrane protein YeaQ/YmgE (transglycosylase-associated protein family)
MKKLIAFVLAIAVLNVSIAVTPPTDGGKSMNATEIMIPIGKTGQKISLMEFSKLTPAEYQKMANVKLKFFDRIAYKVAMKKLKKSISKDGTITNKKVAKMFSPTTDGDSGFHLGGFALGFLLGLIGVLVAYVVFSDDNKANRVKWSWIGLIASVVLSIILVVAVFNKAKSTIE